MVRLLICAGGTGGGVYPALAVLERLNDEPSTVETLWVGRIGGMEENLVTKAGIDFMPIPAAGVHGVGLSRLPKNGLQLIHGLAAARNVIRKFQPNVLFFTGGYVAVPVAMAGLRTPVVLYVPDIEPGLALKFLARFADRILLTTEDSKDYFPRRKNVSVTGYPVRSVLSSWSEEDAYREFGFSPSLPTLFVTGGSLGALTINQALVAVLPDLLQDIQIIHVTGQSTWSQFSQTKTDLEPKLAERYQVFPYLHQEMGAALRISNLVLSRAGASSIGEYPHFGIPAILVPYPHAWRYQKVNAAYLERHGAAIILEDDDLPNLLLPTVKRLLRSPNRLKEMKRAMGSLGCENAAQAIADHIMHEAVAGNPKRN